MDDMMTETIYFFESNEERPGPSDTPKRELPCHTTLQLLATMASKSLKTWMGKDG